MKVTVIDHFLLKVLVVKERKRRMREREFRLKEGMKGRMKVREMDLLPKVVVSSTKFGISENFQRDARSKKNLTFSD